MVGVVKRMLLLMVVISTWNTSTQSVLPKGLRMRWLLLVGNLGVLSTWMNFTCGQKLLLLLLLWLWFSGLAVLPKQSGLQFRVGAQSCCCCCRFRR